MSTRFVVLRHEQAGDVHWDLMLEKDAMLTTWRCPCPLADVGDVSVLIDRIADHRLAYLDYEGPVSGNRGTVRIAERGTFELRRDDPDDWLIVVQSTIGNRVYRVWCDGEQWRIVRAARA